MRSTPIVKDSEVASQPIHARLLQQSKAFADKVISVTNQTSNASRPPPVNNVPINSKQNPVLINPNDHYVLIGQEKIMWIRNSGVYSEIRKLQVRENPRDSPSHSSRSLDRPKYSRKRRKTPPRHVPRRERRSYDSPRRDRLQHHR